MTEPHPYGNKFHAVRAFRRISDREGLYTRQMAAWDPRTRTQKDRPVTVYMTHPGSTVTFQLEVSNVQFNLMSSTGYQKRSGDVESIVHVILKEYGLRK